MHILLLLFLLLSLPLSASSSCFFGVGYRNDRQRFNFANQTIDPRSELEWKGLQAVEFELEPEWVCGSYHLSLDGRFGIITSGIFTDSDWNLTGRQGLYSYFVGSVTGNNYDLDLRLAVDLFCLRPAIGGSYHQQYYRNWSGSDLFNTFRSEWLTGWIGFEGERSFRRCWQLFLSARGHIGGHRSWGDWRGRSDLLPGRGWSNLATAFGVEGEGRLLFWIQPCAAVTLSARYNHFWTAEGNQYFYFVSGGQAILRLKESTWNAAGATLGFTYKY